MPRKSAPTDEASHGQRPPTSAAAPARSKPAGDPDGLNPAQRLAVQTLRGPVLVVAGAGTGKTRTLIHRLVALLQSGVPPESILLLTFTRRAAQEMVERAAALMGPGCERVAGGTFHAFANLMLRRYVPALRECTILDQGDIFDIVGELRAELKLGPQGKSFPRRETLAAIFSKVQNFEVPIAQVVAQEYPHLKKDLPVIAGLQQAYRDYKQKRRLLDFDDLLIELAQRLHSAPEFRRRVTERYHYVMVDEYQDTNIPQARITRLLSGSLRNVMVVGDDAQSIYAFRGARADNLFDFKDEFSDAAHITLEENYRSQQPILDLANALLGQMERAFRKRLRNPRGPQPGDNTPLLVSAMDEEEQARYVARSIVALQEQGVPRSEIAVLFRASSHAHALELELTRLKMPYVKYGGFKFMDAAHIKDALAHLRVVHNPGDDLSLTRVLRLRPGVGPLGARKIREAAQAQAGRSLGAALRDYPAKDPLRGSLQLLGGLLDELGRARDAGAAPGLLLKRACEAYTPMLKDLFEDHERRAKDLLQLCDLCQDFRSLESMLTELSLAPPNTSRGEGLTAPEKGALVLSTVHSAKGLEWRAVFILQANDGSIPMYSGYEEPEPEQLDEELRLLYVAVTRAKEQLHIVWPRSTRRNTFEGCRPSRFLSHLTYEREQDGVEVGPLLREESASRGARRRF